MPSISVSIWFYIFFHLDKKEPASLCGPVSLVIMPFGQIKFKSQRLRLFVFNFFTLGFISFSCFSDILHQG